MSLAPLRMSEKQRFSIKHATGRVNIFEGAIRSGKTFSWLLLMLEKVATAGNQGAILIVGKNRDSIYRNVFEPLATWDAFALWQPFIHYKQGAPTATIFGRVVHVIGANDAKSESKIRGLTVLLAFCDELTVLNDSFFRQLLGRMSLAISQLFGTTNPDSPSHWLKKDFLDRIDDLPDWRRFHFTIDDNPSLPEKIKNQYKAEYTGLWYKRFILGMWVAAEGAIYDMWDEDKHVIPWTDLPPMRDIVGTGIDYGTTHATSAMMLGLGMNGNLYFVDEWRYQASNDAARWTDHRQAAAMRQWLDDPHLPYANSHGYGPVIVDPSAASLRVEFREQHDLHTHPAEKEPVLYRLRTVSSLLGADKLFVSDRCKGWINEVSGYAWDPKATERGKDEPIKTADDSLDAGGYAVVTTERKWRPFVDLTMPTAA